MAIITISRGSLSGGAKLAACLGKTLGYTVLSREDLVARAAELYGLDETRLFTGLSRGPKLLERFRTDRYIYLAVAQATLARLVRGDNVVYHGNAGHLLLDGIRHVLRLRIIAPLELRIRVAMREYGLSEGEAATLIETRDAERKSWTGFLYGIEWGDPGLYDLTINYEKIGFETACEIVEATVNGPAFVPDAEDAQKLDDLYLEAHVKARLFLDPKIGAVAAAIDVSADRGKIVLKGILPGSQFVERAISLCAELPGVCGVDASWLGGRQNRV